jgi:hypothetical protein
MRHGIVGTIALIGLAGTGCEGSVTEAETPYGLAITRHDAERLAGSFRDAHATVRFDAARTAAGDATLVLTLDDKSFGYEGSALAEDHRGWFRVVADRTLEAADRDTARALVDALSGYLGNDVTAMNLHEASVGKMAYWLSQQPAGQLARSFSKLEYFEHEPRTRGLGNDGVTCIKKNTTVTAYYDDRNGVASSVGVLVGSDWGTSNCGAGNYSCMGRCGAGCSGFGGGWTLDCLEHDTCSHNLCATGGSSHPDCGDEYNEASGDIFSSCSGN